MTHRLAERGLSLYESYDFEVTSARSVYRRPLDDLDGNQQA